MLVNCVAYQDGRKVPENTADALVWVALKDPTHEELDEMAARFGLHELAVEDTKRGNQRPKVEEYGDSLFVVLHTVELGTAGELIVGEIDIFVGRNYVLSVRNKAQQGFAQIRERCESEPELLKNGPAFILYALMDAVVDRYFPVIAELEHELERIEERIFSHVASARLNIEHVYHLKRRLMTLQHASVSLEEAVGKLHGGRVPQICHAMQEYFRDVTDHLIRVNRSIDSTREMSTTAIQVNLSMISLAESEVTKKLASYGALFAVPTAIAGIYGMNFKFMPELSMEWGYPAVLALIVVADLLLWRRFRKERWL